MSVSVWCLALIASLLAAPQLWEGGAGWGMGLRGADAASVATLNLEEAFNVVSASSTSKSSANARFDPGGNITYRYIGKIAAKDPSFVRILSCPRGPPSLWVTSFSPLSSGKVMRVFNLSSSYPDFSSAQIAVLSSAFKWPNKISIAPAQLGEYLVVPDGFILPTKETGGLHLLKIDCNGTSSYPHNNVIQELAQNFNKAPQDPSKTSNADPDLLDLTASKLGWFYHMGLWRDMNGDGILDVITARTYKPLAFGNTKGEMLWLEQPASDPLGNTPWKEHKMADGPETVFLLTDLDSDDDQYEIFAPQFFTQHFGLYVFGLKNNSLLYSRYIDETLGPAYMVEVTDLNNDGSPDLLVTNHVGGKGGNVFAYEIPSDLKNGVFKRHTLAGNFTVTESGSHQAAPGFAYSFKPHVAYKGKPYILVAGDGSQGAYLMTPNVETDFSYNKTTIINVDGVIGSIGLGDIVEQDGWTEFVIPDYDHGVLHGYTFAP